MGVDQIGVPYSGMKTTKLESSLLRLWLGPLMSCLIFSEVFVTFYAILLTLRRYLANRSLVLI